MKPINKLLFALGISLLPLSVNAIDCPSLDLDQLHTIQFSYDYGKQYGLELTLATLAYRESSAGKVLINVKSGDFGVYQGNYKTICVQAGVYDNIIACNIELTKVVADNDTAAKHAVETIQWWDDYYSKKHSGNNYERVIRSYHNGFNPFSKQGSDYWKKFKRDMAMIKQCIKLE